MPGSIRLALLSDGAALAAIYRPFVLDTSASFESDPPSAEEMTRRIDQTLAMFPWLVCEDEGGVLGYAYASAHRARQCYQWSVDVSVYVGHTRQRMGIGRRLYGSLLQTIQSQGFVNAYAGITLPNPGSIRLHEAFGFRRIVTYKHVGYKLGAWHDVGWWSLDLGEPATNPLPPTPLPELIRLGGFRLDELEQAAEERLAQDVAIRKSKI